MRFGLLAIGLIVLSGCGNEDVRKQPTVAPASPVITDKESTQEAPAPAAAADACAGPASPASFLCQQEKRCAGLDVTGPLDLYGFLCLVAATPVSDDSSLKMAAIITRLPYRFRRNLSFKHGIQQSPLRGHSLEEKDLTTTANIEHPRVLMWDEDTALTISFNGGPIEGSKADQRSERELHMLSYDDELGEFSFWSVDLPVAQKDGKWQLRPTQPTDQKVDCRRCHGQVSRPIWAMYPDWPGVFGSDTDELTQSNPHQKLELKALARFRKCVVPGASADAACSKSGTLHGDRHQRYAPLFDKKTEQGLAEDFRRIDTEAIRAYLKAKAKGDARRKPKYRLTAAALAVAEGGDKEMIEWLGLELHPNYPFRPNHEKQKSEASRAIFHRPNLRIGALYNRLNSLRVMKIIRKSPAYEPFKKLIAFTLMDCAWQAKDGPKRERVLAAFGALVSKELASRDMALPGADSDGKILYPVLLAALGLQLRDIDIRFSYPNDHFDAFDKAYKRPTYAKTVMDLGYIKYEKRDNNQESGAQRYFNSYFDGSASFDELLVAQILAELGGSYDSLYKLNSFKFKFEDVTSRYELDKMQFAKMDALSRWFPLPYPKHLKPLHNRQEFLRRRSGRYPFRDQHSAVCKQLRSDLL